MKISNHLMSVRGPVEAEANAPEQPPLAEASAPARLVFQISQDAASLPKVRGKAFPLPGGEGQGEGEPTSTDKPKPDRRKPVLVKAGSAVVKIYGRAPGPYTLAWRENSRGPRRRSMRANLNAAKIEAGRIANDIANGEISMQQMNQADRASYNRSVELLAKLPSPPPLEIAVGIYTQCVQKLPPGVTLDEVIKFFLDNQPAGIIPRPCPELVADLLAHLEREGAGRRWIEDLDSRLNRFAKHYTGPLHELRAPVVNAWIESLKLSPRSRNNYRIALMALVAYAKKRSHLPRTWSEMERVERSVEKAVEIRIFTPEQMISLLGAALPNLIPFLTLQAFAGIRHEELSAMDWRDIHLDKSLIYVPCPVAKSGTPDRIIPMQPNLVAWLTPHARRNGPICEISNISGALHRTAARAEVAWLRNAPRKSFISYRLALVKDIGRVADEAGNSPAIIKTNYRRPIPESEAKRWFDIWPTTAAVLQLNFSL